MGEENFNAVFDKVKEVFGLSCILNVLKLSKETLFLNHVDDSNNISEIIEDIVYEFDCVVGHDRADKKHFRCKVI